MNCYQLITRKGAQYFVRASFSHDAIAKIEKLTGDVVSCWFIATSLPKGATIL